MRVRRPIKRGRAEFTPSRWDGPAARETLPCRHNHNRLDEGEIKIKIRVNVEV